MSEINNNFSHLQLINYAVQIGDKTTDKVGIFNCNKLPTGVAIQCIETDTFNPYLLTMTKEHFQSLFLDDAPMESPNDSEDGSDVTADSEDTAARKIMPSWPFTAN